VIDELDQWVRNDGDADVITLSGSGEPTLHSRFGKIIDFVRKVTTIPVVLLTNGSMLGDPEVAESACRAYIVKASLSAWDQFSFEAINRPHGELVFREVLEGLWRFREQFKGELWIEVFVIWGINSVPHYIHKVADLVKAFQPDRVQLNTAVRPSAEDFVEAVPEDSLKKLAELFEPPAEVIAEFNASRLAQVEANEDMILGLIARRPCTVQQVAHAFGMNPNEALKYLGRLLQRGAIHSERVSGDLYYVFAREEAA